MLTKMKKRDLTERDWEAIAKAQGIVAELPVVVDDTETVTLDYVRSAIRRGIPGRDGDTRRPRIVVIDYVQLMKSTGRFSSRQEEVAALSRGLKLLAKSEQVAIVGLVQLNRGPDGRSDKTPVLADIRESGQLENDADIAILLHRPDMYEKESPRAGEIDFIVAKNRDGWTGTIPLCFAGHYSSILDMARDPWGDDS
jgi:replicative DNA helicase